MSNVELRMYYIQMLVDIGLGYSSTANGAVHKQPLLDDKVMLLAHPWPFLASLRRCGR
jgi:hypothetical protein